MISRLGMGLSSKIWGEKGKISLNPEVRLLGLTPPIIGKQDRVIWCSSCWPSYLFHLYSAIKARGLSLYNVCVSYIYDKVSFQVSAKIKTLTKNS